MTDYSKITNWKAFIPVTPEDVLTKIEHLLKITTDDFKKSDGVPVEKKKGRRGRPPAAAAAASPTTTTTAAERKDEAQEDKELIEQEEQHEEHELVQQPPNFVGELRDYQIEGLRWMVQLFDTGVNGILADEMGLGKTAQTISLLGYLADVRKIRGKHLVIVPKSTMSNWAREFSRFYPGLKILSLIGNKEERPAIIRTMADYDVILTTYELTIIESAALKKFSYEYVILDEAHRIKNDNAKISITIRELKAAHRLLITGTPINNNLDELWSLLNFLRPDLFSSNEEFRLLFDEDAQQAALERKKFRDQEQKAKDDAMKDEDDDDNNNNDDDNKDAPSTIPNNSSEEIDEETFNLELKEEEEDTSTTTTTTTTTTTGPTTQVSESQNDTLSRLHRILRPFLLRRLKTDVAKQLLPKIETKVYVKLSKLQRSIYKNLLSKDLDSLNTQQANQGKPRLLNLAMQLRKVTNHPYLFDGVEPEPFENGPHLIDACGKLIVLDKLLAKLQQQGRRVLIFSQMTRMVDILEDYCNYREFEYCRIDGNTEHTDRERLIDQYNKPNSEKFIFLLSTRAGGLGINLQTADTVILYDSDWNPQMDLQAMDRAHRIGQKGQVLVYRLVTDGTIEERVVERALKKLALDALIIQKGRQSKAQGPSANEIQAMVRFGADKIYRMKDDEDDDSALHNFDVDQLLQDSQKRTQDEASQINRDVLDLSQFSFSHNESEFDIHTLEGQTTDMLTNVESFYIEPPTRSEHNKQVQEQEFTKKYEKLCREIPPIKEFTRSAADHHLYIRSNDLTNFMKRQWQYRERCRHYRDKLKARLTCEQSIGIVCPFPFPAQEEEHPDHEKYEGLTKEESEDKDAILATGFPSWAKRHVEQFFGAIYIHGADIEAIASAIPEKTLDEVRAYYEAFMSRVDFAIDPAAMSWYVDLEDESTKVEFKDWKDINITIHKPKYKIQATVVVDGVERVVSQDTPLQVKDAKYWVSRAHSMAKFTVRTESFRQKLQYKIKEAITTYQDLATLKQTATQPIPVVSTFFECFQLRYFPLQPRNASSVPETPTTRSTISLYSKDFYPMWVKFGLWLAKERDNGADLVKASEFLHNVWRQEGVYGILNNFKGNDTKIAQQLTAANGKFVPMAITASFRNVSSHNVPNFGIQFTPTYDAMILYALSRSDVSLPYLSPKSQDDDDNTTNTRKTQATTNTVLSLVNSLYNMDMCYELLKRMPGNCTLSGMGSDAYLLTPQQLLDRVLYLINIVESEDIPDLNTKQNSDASKVDHSEDPKSIFYPQRLNTFNLRPSEPGRVAKKAKETDAEDKENKDKDNNNNANGEAPAPKKTGGRKKAATTTTTTTTTTGENEEPPAPTLTKKQTKAAAAADARAEKARLKEEKEKERLLEKERKEKEKEAVKLEKERLKREAQMEKELAKRQKAVDAQRVRAEKKALKAAEKRKNMQDEEEEEEEEEEAEEEMHDGEDAANPKKRKEMADGDNADGVEHTNKKAKTE